jgi:hypothetical protein
LQVLAKVAALKEKYDTSTASKEALQRKAATAKPPNP